MTPDEQIAALTQKVALLEKKIAEFYYPDRYQFQRSLRHNGNQLGFFGKALMNQWASGTGRQDISGNTGVGMNVGAKFDGNTGTTYYSVGDIVAALKAYGLLAQ